MKRFIVFSALLFISTNTFAQSNGLYIEKSSCSNAIEYNDYIVDLVQLIDNAWDKAIEETDLKKALTANNDLKNISGKIIVSLKKLEGFSGETDFKLAVNNYATHMSSISKKELPKFLKLIRAKGEITTAKEKQAEALIPILDDKRENLFSLIERAQTAFAQKNNFTIEK